MGLPISSDALWRIGEPACRDHAEWHHHRGNSRPARRGKVGARAPQEGERAGHTLSRHHPGQSRRRRRTECVHAGSIAGVFFSRVPSSFTAPRASRTAVGIVHGLELTQGAEHCRRRSLARGDDRRCDGTRLSPHLAGSMSWPRGTIPAAGAALTFHGRAGRYRGLPDRKRRGALRGEAREDMRGHRGVDSRRCLRKGERASDEMAQPDTMTRSKTRGCWR